MSVSTAYIGIILIWSTTPLAIQWSGDGPGFMFGVTSRMFIGAFICLLILAFMRVKLVWHKQALLTYTSASMGVFGSMLCVYWAAQYITSGMISVLFGLTPLLTSIFAALILNERSLSFHKILGITFGVCGLITIFYTDIVQGQQAYYGMLAVIVATALHSLSTVVIKKIDCTLPGIVVNTGTLIISCILFLIVWVVAGVELPENIPLKSGASILYLGVLGNVVGFTLFYYALKHLDASKIGLIPLITPVLALLLGYLLNNETMDWQLAIGSGLILSGLIAHHWNHFVDRYKVPAPQ